MDWPAELAGISPAENIWEIMTRYVYQGKRQFQNIDELKDTISEGLFVCCNNG